MVGISRYADATVPTLGYARKDAETFASTLRDAAIGRFLPDRVITLLDDQATLRNVKSQIELLARVVTEDDLFVVFLSTHAAPGEVDLAGDPYFVAYDTEKSDLYATGLAMRELTDALLHRIRARHVVAFLDACCTGEVLARSRTRPHRRQVDGLRARGWRSGPRLLGPRMDSLARGSRDPAVPAPPRATTPSDKSIVLMTSSGDGTEPSWESDSLGHGVFTYYLVEALRESRGLATVGWVLHRLRTRVAQQVAAEKQRQQQPRLFYSDPPRVAIGAPAVSWQRRKQSMTKPVRIYLLMALTLLGCASSGKSSDGAARVAMEAGKQYAQSGLYDQAITRFKEAIAEDDESAAAYMNLGVCYIQKGRDYYATARENLSVSPPGRTTGTDPPVWYNLAVIYTLTDVYDKALDALDRALGFGFKDYDALRTDKDLRELRKREQFRAVLERHNVFL